MNDTATTLPSSLLSTPVVYQVQMTFVRQTLLLDFSIRVDVVKEDVCVFKRRKRGHEMQKSKSPIYLVNCFDHFVDFVSYLIVILFFLQEYQKPACVCLFSALLSFSQSSVNST